MAILSDVVTFEGEDAGFFLKPVTENPEITSLGIEIMDEVVDSYIYLNKELDKITKANTDCGLTDSTGATQIYRKKIDLVELKAYKEQCYKIFDQTVFKKMLKRGTDVANMTEGEIATLLQQFVTPVITRDAMRILLLGDTTNASANYNMMDGILKQLSDGATAADGSGRLIPNLGNVTDAMLSSTNDVILDTFQDIWELQDRKLKQVPNSNKVFWVTGSVWDAWGRYQQSKVGNLESSMTKVINGVSTYSFNGVPILPLWILDEYLTADFQISPSGFSVGENIIILTDPSNHVLALDTQAAGNEVKFWYDENTEKNKFKAVYQMGYKYKYPELQVIAGI